MNYIRNMKVIGLMGNNKEKEDIFQLMEEVSQECGIMVKELNGWIKVNRTLILNLKIGIHMFNLLQEKHNYDYFTN